MTSPPTGRGAATALACPRPTSLLPCRPWPPEVAWNRRASRPPHEKREARVDFAQPSAAASDGALEVSHHVLRASFLSLAVFVFGCSSASSNDNPPDNGTPADAAPADDAEATASDAGADSQPDATDRDVPPDCQRIALDQPTIIASQVSGEGLNVGSLSAWQRRFRVESPSTTTFAPLVVETKPETGQQGFELTLRDGMGLRIPADFDEAMLTRIVRAIGAAR